MPNALTTRQFEFLCSIDTPTACNLIEVVAPNRRGFGYTVKHLHCPFPDLQVGEDSHFICYGGSKKICDLSSSVMFVGMVHAGNTSYKETTGSFWRPEFPAHIERLLGADLDAYRALLGSPNSERWPLISCIMPTYNRRPFLPLALRCFLDQDYPNKELIIVDDGEDRRCDGYAGRCRLRR